MIHQCRICCGTSDSCTSLEVPGLAWWATVGVGVVMRLAPFDTLLLQWAIASAFGFVMVVITFIDIDHKLILNKVTIPSIVIFYGLGLLLPERQWWTGLVGAAIGYGLPWTIGEIYYRITKREGLGLGDSMLLALIGALLGWKGVVFALFGGSVIGSVIGIGVLLAARSAATPDAGSDQVAVPDPATEPEAPRDDGSADGDDADPPSLMRTELPFGPFLAAAAVFYVFAERWINVHFHLPGG